MADNGSSMFISGDPDDNWDNDDLGTLKQVPASAFEVILMSPIYTPQNVPQGPNPVINNFTANPPNPAPRQPVTLSWNASGALYFIVSPQIGAIRGNSIVVTPPANPSQTTYTLYATNQYGRSEATVVVTIQ